MATESTPNYNLDLYGSADSANLRDQYNAAMGKIDGELLKLNNSDTTFNNLIANINREIETINNSVDQANTYIGQLQALTGDQGDLIKANKDAIAGLQSTVNTHSDHLTTIDGEIGTLMSESQALTATVEAHGTAITDVQKTADDALSLAQTNETDIAAAEVDILKNTQAIYADSMVGGWDVYEGILIPNVTLTKPQILINKGKGLFKFTCRVQIPANNLPTTPTFIDVPGSPGYKGIKVFEDIFTITGLPRPTEAMVFSGVGSTMWQSSQGNVSYGIGWLCIGTDGGIYAMSNNSVGASGNTETTVYIQTPCSLVNIDLPAPTPPED